MTATTGTGTPSAAISGRPVHSLPSIWPGYVAAFILLFVDFAETAFDPTRAGDVTSPLWIVLNVAFYLYWFFCIYRVHVVLREATGSAYPIGPVKAVGFSFIPFFNLYWVFRWPNAIADFVNANSSVRMRRVWPGIGLLAGLLLIRVAGELAVAVDFTVMLYIVRKLARIFPP